MVWLDGSAESPTRIGVEIVWSHDQELQPVRGNEGFPALVVESALKTAVNATDGESIRLVEEGSRSVVLTLSILDNQPERGPVSVYRKSNLPAALPGVTFEPFKAMLSRRGLTEDRVTEVDHIRFVTGGTTTRTLLIAHGAPEAEPLR
ncbi:MAG: hypothetical protein KIT89_04410 [Microcella sp.]|uniref:hypothetical protein n=1 Tax=Microcella sp. TaxID=1913979 RepID=UPI0024CC11AE|nr:hypothetical protein [Microcella sp.]UYN84440.1 MAG: hypothetical protein KIT89_04410 [Microcella sp.]